MPPIVKSYTPSQAADLLGLSVRTIRRAVLAGELAAIRYNSRVWRITATDAALWYASRGGRLSTSRTTPPER